jgi:hypothetical protein
VGDQDWLDKGHGGGEGLRPMIKGTSGHAPDRVSIRSVLRGGEVAQSRRPRRRTKALVGWLLYCCTAIGGTAAAFTVRDTLFPQLGAPTRTNVWANSNADTTLSTEHGFGSSTQPDTTAVETTVAATTVSAPAQSVETQADPVATDSNSGPGNSVENTVDSHRPNSGAVPQTGTTIDDNPSGGPGPGTTIADDPTDSSTPNSTPGSASSPPSSSEPTATPGDPAGDTSPNHGKGKGGGEDDPPTP